MPQHSLSLHAIISATKVIQVKLDIQHNPYKYLSNTPGGVQASASQPPTPPTEKLLLFIFTLQVGCCVSLHPLGGAEHKQHSFQIHAGLHYLRFSFLSSFCQLRCQTCPYQTRTTFQYYYHVMLNQWHGRIV